MDRRSFIVITVLMLGSISSLLAQAAPKPTAKPAKPAVVIAPGDIVNLNTATAAQIATLPGIGPKTAELIVQYRTKQKGFKKIEEIMNVRGIGEKTFLKLKSRITVTSGR